MYLKQISLGDGLVFIFLSLLAHGCTHAKNSFAILFSTADFYLCATCRFVNSSSGLVMDGVSCFVMTSTASVRH